jgi:hypothetical protein
VDIIVELDKKFKAIITSRLDMRSQEAITNQEDPATMTDVDQLKIKKAILHRVYGEADSVTPKIMYVRLYFV